MKINISNENKFNIMATILVIILAITLTPITFQNDTYYTIKVGESIVNNGIDMQDHLSWHEDLNYTYPHWLYDLMTYGVYSYFGFTGVYILTCIFSAILAITIYFTNSKICKNNIISFFITFITLFFIRAFIAARAQLVTFILFVLTIYFIEKHLENKNKIYALGLILIPIIIANIHIAVFPFYFILYLPYIGEYIIAKLMFKLPFSNLKLKHLQKRLKKCEENKRNIKLEKKLKIKIEKSKKSIGNKTYRFKELKSSSFKIKIEENDNVKSLIIVMIISLFTGFLTPLGTNLYTYLVKTMMGNTTAHIKEHAAITLARFPEALIFIAIFIIILTFTKVKIKLSDLFLVGGLTILTIFSQRQFSMLALLGSFTLSKLVFELISLNPKNQLRQSVNLLEGFLFVVVTILICICILRNRIKEKFIDESSYPVLACDFINQNIDIKNSRFYNEYNYGSYMIFRNIPVFIDSRADLYDPKFSHKENDIFMDYITTDNLNTFCEETFEKYQITHIITQNGSSLNNEIRHLNSPNYNKIYKDDNFTIYEYIRN